MFHEHLIKEVAVFPGPANGLVMQDLELGIIIPPAHLLQVLPVQGERHKRFFPGPEGIDADHGLGGVVLGPVDEDLAVAVFLGHFGGDQVRVIFLQDFGHDPGKFFGIRKGGLDRKSVV